jgi:hypothetical protein
MKFTYTLLASLDLQVPLLASISNLHLINVAIFLITNAKTLPENCSIIGLWSFEVLCLLTQ